MKCYPSSRAGQAVLVGSLVFGVVACGTTSSTSGNGSPSSGSSGTPAGSSGTPGDSSGTPGVGSGTPGVGSGSPAGTSTGSNSDSSGSGVGSTGDGAGSSSGSGDVSSGGPDGGGSSGNPSSPSSGSGGDLDAGVTTVLGDGGGITNLACPSGNAICAAKTWNDITSMHTVPAWVKTAKLGIGMHFMVSTVPAHHNEWFIQHEYCNTGFATWTSQNFPTTSPLSGGPWGYKDFIPLFTVSQWSLPAQAHQATTAASWAALFKASGATFVNATAEHHDRFAMWDSSEPASLGGAATWNAMKMGPKRDVVGELAAAVKAQGMKFGVNNHIMYGYSFVYCGPNGTTPGNVGPKTPASVSDLYDPRYASFYGPPSTQCGALAGACPAGQPDQQFCDSWLYRSEELADKYQLDDEWFDWDGANTNPCLANKLTFALHFYQQAAARGQQSQLMSKGGVFPNMNNSVTGANVSVQDFQSSIPSGNAVPTSPWLTDETISSNGSWCYVEPMTYKSPDSVVSELKSINAGGGIMLLNVSPQKDGTIPTEQIAILNAVGKYLGAAGNF